MKIGMALSGGGFRATVFHLGVLARLARETRLEEVSFVSTVSGGSLCAGIIMGLNGYQWPTSQVYLEQVLPAARRLLTTTDLQRELLMRVIRAPWRILETKADRMSGAMRQLWGIEANLSDLPESPRWMINATCYETGKNWRFERFRMGDYVFGYTNDTADVPVTDAMAASSGFPGLIGPLPLNTAGRRWFRYTDRRPEPTSLTDAAALSARTTEPIEPAYPELHFWDGGVYDNHGLEGIHDFITGWRSGVDFFIVSDGAGKSSSEAYRPGVRALLRIATGIMMDQIRSLRARAIIERFVNHEDRGAFLQIGNTCAHVLRSAGKPELIEQHCAGALSDAEARAAEVFATVIRKLTTDEFELLFRHGFEVADVTLHAYNSEDFAFLGYSSA